MPFSFSRPFSSSHSCLKMPRKDRFRYSPPTHRDPELPNVSFDSSVAEVPSLLFPCHGPSCREHACAKRCSSSVPRLESQPSQIFSYPPPQENPFSDSFFSAPCPRMLTLGGHLDQASLQHWKECTAAEKPGVSVTSLRDRGMDEPFTVAAPACSHLASVTQRGASNEDIRKDCVFTISHLQNP